MSNVMVKANYEDHIQGEREKEAELVAELEERRKTIEKLTSLRDEADEKAKNSRTLYKVVGMVMEACLLQSGKDVLHFLRDEDELLSFTSKLTGVDVSVK
jgi:uncharacterized protein YhaN